MQHVASFYSQLLDDYPKGEFAKSKTHALVICNFPTDGFIVADSMSSVSKLLEMLRVRCVELSPRSVFKAKPSKNEIIAGIESIFLTHKRTFEDSLLKLLQTLIPLSFQDFDLILPKFFDFISRLSRHEKLNVADFKLNCGKVISELQKLACDQDMKLNLIHIIEELLKALDLMLNQKASNLLIVYTGPTQQDTGDWLCLNGQTISIEEILEIWSKYEFESRCLSIVHDGSHSGSWVERFASQDTVSKLILQSSCAKDMTLAPGEFLTSWVRAQHPSCRNTLISEEGSTAKYLSPQKELQLDFWPTCNHQTESPAKIGQVNRITLPSRAKCSETALRGSKRTEPWLNRSPRQL
jgi:hypothetical protein